MAASARPYDGYYCLPHPTQEAAQHAEQNQVRACTQALELIRSFTEKASRGAADLLEKESQLLQRSSEELASKFQQHSHVLRQHLSSSSWETYRWVSAVRGVDWLEPGHARRKAINVELQDALAWKAVECLQNNAWSIDDALRSAHGPQLFLDGSASSRVKNACQKALRLLQDMGAALSQYSSVSANSREAATKGRRRRPRKTAGVEREEHACNPAFATFYETLTEHLRIHERNGFPEEPAPLSVSPETAAEMRQGAITTSQEKIRIAHSSIDAAMEACGLLIPDLLTARARLQEDTEPLAFGTAEAQKAVHNVVAPEYDIMDQMESASACAADAFETCADAVPDGPYVKFHPSSSSAVTATTVFYPKYSSTCDDDTFQASPATSNLEKLLDEAFGDLESWLQTCFAKDEVGTSDKHMMWQTFTAQVPAWEAKVQKEAALDPQCAGDTCKRWTFLDGSDVNGRHHFDVMHQRIVLVLLMSGLHWILPCVEFEGESAKASQLFDSLRKFSSIRGFCRDDRMAIVKLTLNRKSYVYSEYYQISRAQLLGHMLQGQAASAMSAEFVDTAVATIVEVGAWFRQADWGSGSKEKYWVRSDLVAQLLHHSCVALCLIFEGTSSFGSHEKAIHDFAGRNIWHYQSMQKALSAAGNLLQRISPESEGRWWQNMQT